METLRIKKEFQEPVIEMFREDNMALIQYAPMPGKPLRDEFIGDFLVAHVNETNEIISVTVTNVEEFAKKTKERQVPARKHWFGWGGYKSKDITDIIPNEIIYQIQICT